MPNQELVFYQFSDGSIGKEWYDAELGGSVQQIASMDDVHNAHARALEAIEVLRKRWFVWRRRRKLKELKHFTQACTKISYRSFHQDSYEDHSLPRA